MSEWTDGYVADIGYTYGYYTELNPLRQRLAFLLSGLAVPEIRTACELGFGQGVSVNIHAAASTVQWYGNDFNPSQAAFAKGLAAAAGAGANLTDDSFAEFAARTDLPMFDYIGLHGIWSWISEENRQTIVKFVSKHLNVGGVLYISYNTLPGWSPFAPVRHFLSLHSKIMGADGQGPVGRIDGALEAMDKLLATSPHYARTNPSVLDRFKKVKAQNRNYIAHEYFNRDWLPMHFSLMSDYLTAAKLQYACSAHYHDHVDSINFTPEQRELLSATKDATLRETTKDFFVNQSFRRDYWVKGARRLDAVEQSEALRAQKVVLVKHRADVPLKITSPAGDVSLSPDIYTPVLDFMAGHEPRSLAQIEAGVQKYGVNIAQIAQCMMILAGAGYVSPVQEDGAIVSAKESSEKINREIIARARGNSDLQNLASPVTGGGVVATRFQLLFLMAINQGKRQPREWVELVWQILKMQGQSIIKDGKQLVSESENIEELQNQAAEFELKIFPVFRALMIVG